MYWIVRAKWGGYDDKTELFLEKNYWENGYDNKYIERVNKIEKGDTLLLADKSYIKYFGECKSNPKNGKMVYVDGWKALKKPFYFQAKGAYIQTIVRLRNRDFVEKVSNAIKLIQIEHELFISKLDVYDFMSLPNGSIKFSRGINLLIGENGSGKSQILKLLYSIIEANNEIRQENENSDYEKQRIIAKNLTDIFKAEKLGNLVNRDKKESKITLDLNEYRVSFKFGSNSSKEVSKHLKDLKQNFIYKKAIFIPAKEVLSFYKGFRIMYERKYLEFDKTYYNLCRALEEPLLKETQFNHIISELEDILDGKIEIINGRFYLLSNGKKFEINLVAEGFRKIGMLAYLLKNDALDKNSVLVWDEPEANMHPKLIDDIIHFLVILANEGLQIFISTHSPYVIESFNNHLKRHKIDNLNIEDNEIKNVIPLNSKNISAYLLEKDSLINILDNELGLLDDKLLHNFNEINSLYEKMRDIEWDKMEINSEKIEDIEWDGIVKSDNIRK